jgi:hypothetical protein
MGFKMKTLFSICLAVCSWFEGCDISIKIVLDAPKVQPQPQRESALPKRFYNPATAEDYDNAHRYLERNPEKPAPKPQIKKPWEPELYGPS